MRLQGTGQQRRQSPGQLQETAEKGSRPQGARTWLGTLTICGEGVTLLARQVPKSESIEDLFGVQDEARAVSMVEAWDTQGQNSKTKTQDGDTESHTYFSTRRFNIKATSPLFILKYIFSVPKSSSCWRAENQGWSKKSTGEEFK